MPGKRYEAQDKRVQKMSREGLGEETLHSGERKRISSRTTWQSPPPAGTTRYQSTGGARCSERGIFVSGLYPGTSDTDQR